MDHACMHGLVLLNLYLFIHYRSSTMALLVNGERRWTARFHWCQHYITR